MQGRSNHQHIVDIAVSPWLPVSCCSHPPAIEDAIARKPSTLPSKYFNCIPAGVVVIIEDGIQLMGIVGTHVDGLEDMSSLPASRARRRLLWFGDNDTFRQRVAVDNRRKSLSIRTLRCRWEDGRQMPEVVWARRRLWWGTLSLTRCYNNRVSLLQFCNSTQQMTRSTLPAKIGGLALNSESIKSGMC